MGFKRTRYSGLSQVLTLDVTGLRICDDSDMEELVRRKGQMLNAAFVRTCKFYYTYLGRYLLV
jgi:hypothetical protein